MNMTPQYKPPTMPYRVIKSASHCSAIPGYIQVAASNIFSDSFVSFTIVRFATQWLCAAQFQKDGLNAKYSQTS